MVIEREVIDWSLKNIIDQISAERGLNLDSEKYIKMFHEMCRRARDGDEN